MAKLKILPQLRSVEVRFGNGLDIRSSWMILGRSLPGIWYSGKIMFKFIKYKSYNILSVSCYKVIYSCKNHSYIIKNKSKVTKKCKFYKLYKRKI